MNKIIFNYYFLSFLGRKAGGAGAGGAGAGGAVGGDFKGSYYDGQNSLHGTVIYYFYVFFV